MLKHEEQAPKHSAVALSKLWHNWNSIGFYDGDFHLPTRDQKDLHWDTHVTDAVRRYWSLYHQSCVEADILIHLEASINNAEELFGEGLPLVNSLFGQVTPKIARVEQAFRYNWVEETAADKHVLVVSPFAPLIDKQVETGNLARLRPNFKPDRVETASFPYCFGNAGPHRNVFETIDVVTEALSKRISPGSVVMLSCGSMGVPIAHRLYEQGANVFYCGGAMQLYFGIMGDRWRRRPPETYGGLYVGDDLLGSHKTHPELWIDPVPSTFVPEYAANIEKGCYW